MPDLFFGANNEAGCFLAGEGAQALPVPTSTLELDVFTHNVLNAEPSLDILHCVHLY